MVVQILTRVAEGLHHLEFASAIIKDISPRLSARIVSRPMQQLLINVINISQMCLMTGDEANTHFHSGDAERELAIPEHPAAIIRGPFQFILVQGPDKG